MSKYWVRFLVNTILAVRTRKFANIITLLHETYLRYHINVVLHDA